MSLREFAMSAVGMKWRMRVVMVGIHIDPAFPLSIADGCVSAVVKDKQECII